MKYMNSVFMLLLFSIFILFICFAVKCILVHFLQGRYLTIFKSTQFTIYADRNLCYILGSGIIVFSFFGLKWSNSTGVTNY